MKVELIDILMNLVHILYGLFIILNENITMTGFPTFISGFNICSRFLAM